MIEQSVSISLLKVFTGLIFENNSNFCLKVTATLLGAPGTGMVVVGPLKHASTSSNVCIVESGMYDVSFLPFSSHCSVRFLRLVDLIPSWRVGPEIKHTLNVALPKRQVKTTSAMQTTGAKSLLS